MFPVASKRGGPFTISWEVHGTGPIKLVVGCYVYCWDDAYLFFEDYLGYSFLVAFDL